MSKFQPVLAEDLFDFLDLVMGADTPCILYGKPGVGKSSMIRQYALERSRRESFGFFILNMATATVADIQGYLVPVDTDHMQRDGTMKKVKAGTYTYPHFLFDEFTGKPASEFDAGVIVLEEWGQGGSDEKRAAAQIIHDRSVGGHKFAHLNVVMLSNMPGGRNGVGKDFYFIVNRRIEAELIPTLKQYLIHGAETGMHPLSLAFAARNEVALFNADEPEAQGAWLTCRSMSALDRILRESERSRVDFDSPIVLTAAAGAVGAGEAHKFIAFAKARSKIPTVSAIAANPEGAPIPAELDVLTFLIFDLAAKTTKDNIKHLVRYINRLPIDMGVTYFTTACLRDKSLVSTSEFSKFSMDNVTLMAAAAARRARLARP